MSLQTSDYDYALPDDLIAMYPSERREDSRLMVVDKKSGQISHHQFFEIADLVSENQLVVLNNTKVIPARLKLGARNAELLLLQQMEATIWRCLVRPGKWFSAGRKFSVQGLDGEVMQIFENGDRLIRFSHPIDFTKTGELPLPPYITRDFTLADRERYQTVYATELGAIAAPTAGLHFTPEILARLPHAFITLHVGVGTFRPVKTGNLSEHEMHREAFEVSEQAALRINEAPEVLAVGTTTVRTLESLMRSHGRIVAGQSGTELFIFPPFEFRRVNSLLTNFHLPKSTLLMLVAAFAGHEFILEVYRKAVENRYRFFSYGDCMLIR